MDEELEFLVLASDGLWDVVPNEVRSICLKNIYQNIIDHFNCFCKFEELAADDDFFFLNFIIPPSEDNCFVNTRCITCFAKGYL